MRAVLLSCFGMVLVAACGRNELEPAAFSCPEYQSVCQGLCTDTSRDAEHCGGCGLACDSGQECIASKCRPTCEGDESLCAVGCVNLDRDPDHCGECNNECASGARCVNGECQGGDCEAPEELCGGECVDTSANRLHCGECFEECPGDLLCNEGSCEADCGDNQLCDDECVDTSSDPNHCGNCVTACAADEVCLAGNCAPECDGGLVACGEICVDLDSHFFNCGECFNVCSFGQSCQNGTCSGCAVGMADCGGQCVDLDSDPNNCGGCGFVCDVACSGCTAVCSEGACARVCDPGLTECGQACVDLSSDPANCGACDSPCNGLCQGGACEPVCGDLSLCGNECVDLESDAANCGACANACDAGLPCQGGFCVLECVGETDYCSGRCVDFQVDPDNCGGCGIACDTGLVCSLGSCVLECPAPTIDCGGSCIDARFDPDNCGACGVECTSPQTCSQGQCSGSPLGCDWTSRAVPYLLNGAISVGGITLDDDCNLYVAMQRDNVSSGGSVYAIDYETEAVTLIAELPRLARGVVYNPADATLYVTSLDRLVAMQTDGSNVRELEGSVAGQYLNGITLAPAGFGAYGGHLIVAQNSGAVLAFDPANAIPEVVQTLAPFVSDVVFGGENLYVAAYSSQQIVQLTADGIVSVVADLPCEPDGLAVDAGVRLFAGCGRDSTIYQVGVGGGMPTLVASAALNPGWAPVGLLYDNGALFVIEEVTGLNAFFP